VPYAHERTLVWRLLRRWIARRSLSLELGDTEPSASGVHRRAQAVLSQVMNALSTTQRRLLAPAFREAFEMIERSRGVAAEEALRTWVAGYGRDSLREWLQAWRRSSALSPMVTPGADSCVAAVDAATHSSSVREQTSGHSVRAVLLSLNRDLGSS